MVSGGSVHESDGVLAEQVERLVLYFDVFHHPLTVAEVERFVAPGETERDRSGLPRSRGPEPRRIGRSVPVRAGSSWFRGAAPRARHERGAPLARGTARLADPRAAPVGARRARDGWPVEELGRAGRRRRLPPAGGAGRRVDAQVRAPGAASCSPRRAAQSLLHELPARRRPPHDRRPERVHGGRARDGRSDGGRRGVHRAPRCQSLGRALHPGPQLVARARAPCTVDRSAALEPPRRASTAPRRRPSRRPR